MTIQILGMGCPKCQMLARNAQRAIQDTGIDAQIEKITDMETITEMGMLVSPGLAVNNELIQSGRILSSEQIARILRERSEAQ
ncbi:MAG: thioredoxin family protein [Spirochaetaceae bacterium]|nr:MAG: thioredoxin family protein [Spirochaetaceae bacterium]